MEVRQPGCRAQLSTNRPLVGWSTSATRSSGIRGTGSLAVVVLIELGMALGHGGARSGGRRVGGTWPDGRGGPGLPWPGSAPASEPQQLWGAMRHGGRRYMFPAGPCRAMGLAIAGWPLRACHLDSGQLAWVRMRDSLDEVRGDGGAQGPRVRDGMCLCAPADHESPGDVVVPNDTCVSSQRVIKQVSRHVSCHLVVGCTGQVRCPSHMHTPRRGRSPGEI